jgi:hypothetical protein
MFAVGASDAGLKGQQIAVMAEHLMEALAEGDQDAFRQRVADHFGLDMFDEFYWREPGDFREL